MADGDSSARFMASKARDKAERATDKAQGAAGKAERSRAADWVEGVGQLANGIVHPLSRRLRHSFGSVQDPAHGRRRHVCVTGNILNCLRFPGLYHAGEAPW